MIRLRSFILLLFLLTACSPSIPANTGLAGTVTLGPVCPVVQVNHPCPDQSYQATLTILTSTGKQVKQFTTDADGKFQIPLAPGDYILHPETPENQPMPFAQEQPFSVVAGQFTQIEVVYDSGIR